MDNEYKERTNQRMRKAIDTLIEWMPSQLEKDAALMGVKICIDMMKETYNVMELAPVRGEQ